MAEPKTKPTDQGVDDFIDGVENEQNRDDARALDKLMQEITGEKPVMWGPSIIGYGNYHYVYESGREGDWMLTGFSPRKSALTLYIMSGFSNYNELLSRLGKHKIGKSCLYIKKLGDIDLNILSTMIKESINEVKKRYADKQ